MNVQIGLAQSGVVYPDGWSAGYPLWTEKGWKFQNIVVETLMQQFKNDFEIKIHYPNVVADLDAYCKLYGARMDRYESSFPVYASCEGKKMIITDSLPYNLRLMAQDGIGSLLTYYYVVRLLKAKKIPMSRDCYISPLLQLNLCLNAGTAQSANQYVISKCSRFLREIGLPVVALSYPGVPGYSKDVFMFAARNAKNTLSTVLQCSLLSESLLDSFGLDSQFRGEYVFDIGYSQKLFAYLADNNLDEYGIRWPSCFLCTDSAILCKELDPQQEERLRTMSQTCRFFLDFRLGKKKLKSLKHEYVQQGVRYIFVQRHVDGETFFSFFHSGGRERVSFEEMCNILVDAPSKLDCTFFEQGMRKLDTLTAQGFGYVSEFSSPGRVVNLFL